MSNPFFDHPILNSPYEPPSRHWELDESGQPTQQIADFRRRAEFFMPIPRPASSRIAVKVINHLGDEVMKVFRV